MNKVASEALIAVSMSIAIAVVGQVLLKIGMDRIGNVHVSGFQSIVQMIFDISRTWQVVVGL
ncbi:MAG: hypothetical protein KJ747_08550, partial [Actinobacteria bacterium]|nr:hypothetical protein [Actinomycetota bacterium]MCG2807173.1 hypothetical protein [Coriobacteriia bacterium]